MPIFVCLLLIVSNTLFAEPSAGMERFIQQKISDSQSGTQREVRVNNSVQSFYVNPWNGYEGQTTKITIAANYIEYTKDGVLSLPVSQAWIDFGDGSAVRRTSGGGSISHSYPSEGGRGKTYKGKITFYTSQGMVRLTTPAGDVRSVSSQSKRFVEPFTYTVWMSESEANKSEYRNGQRVMPQTPETVTECGGFIDGSGTCRLLDEETIVDVLVNDIYTSCSGRCDYSNNSGVAAQGSGLSDVVINFRTSQIKAASSHVTKTGCFKASAGSGNNNGPDGEMPIKPNEPLAPPEGATEADILAYQRAMDDYHDALAVYNEALADFGTNDSLQSSAAVSGWYSMNERYNLNNANYGFYNISGANGALSYFTCSGRNGGRFYSRKDGHSWAFYMNMSRRLNPVQLGELCTANNRSYLKITGARGEDLGRADCSNNWIVDLPKYRYQWDGRPIRAEMVWIFEDFPNTNDKPVGGGVMDGLEKQIYQERSHIEASF